LEDVADQIRRGIAEFIGQFTGRVRLIEDRFPRTPDLRKNDLPTWNLGVNFKLNELELTEIARLLRFFQRLSEETSRDFAVGYYDANAKIGEDIGFIERGRQLDSIVRALEKMRE